MEIKLYFCKKNKSYYYIKKDELSCNGCNKDIENILILHHSFTKKKFIEQTYCLDCIPKIKNKGIVDEFKTCIIINKEREDLIPCFINPPILTNFKGLSTFNITEILNNSEAQIIDYTLISGRKEQNSIDEYNQNMKLLEKRDEMLSQNIETLDLFDNFMQNVKDSVPLIEKEEIKRIEHDPQD